MYYLNMKYINKIKLTGGYKNDTFKFIDEDGKKYFLKIKKMDGFNHEINYKVLDNFNFVPNLIQQNKNELVWEYIDGKKIEFNETNLLKISSILKELHNSKISLPKSNHMDRLLQYYDDIKNKTNIPLEVNKYFDKAKQICANLKTNTPLHNDPWLNNWIEQNNKVFLIDWEYSTMGDKHFDLAFFIEGSYLNKEQEKKFLKEYCDYDEQKLTDAKFFVNYLTLIWIHKFDKLPFPDKNILKYLNEYKK